MFIMHFMYLDASGDPGWPPPNGKSKTAWYVLLGLTLEESLWEQTHRETQKVLDSHLPFQLVDMRELRYSSLLAGVPPYDVMTPLQRKELADEVFELVLRLKPVLFAAAIQKTKHRARYLQKAISPDIWALQLIAPRFHKFLERTNARGIFVMDEEETKKDTRLKKLIQGAREQGIVLSSALPLTNTKLPRLIESVIFTSSQECSCIQLADFCGHAVWKHFERGMSYRFKQIHSLFDEHNGITYGLKVWP